MMYVMACRPCGMEFAAPDHRAASVELTTHLRREHLPRRKDRSLDRWLKAKGAGR